MKTTVLLATCNGEKYLPSQLDSIAGQTFSDFQVLWQDDGSSDHTLDLLNERSVMDARFQPAKEQGKHLGAAANFFSLLTQADGDLLFFCDQDDVWVPDKLQRMVEAFTQTEGHDGTPLLVHSDASLISENGSLIHPSFFHLEGWDPDAVRLSQLLVQNNVTGCLMMINRPLADLVIRHGDPGKMFMHDWFIALTASAFGRIVFLPQPLVRYRQHGSNAIGASRQNLFQRGMKALHEKEKAKSRIRLTYSHTRSFQEAYGCCLPPEAQITIDRYLSIESQSKLRRIHLLRKYGYLMQNPVTRLGQYLFG